MLTPFVSRDETDRKVALNTILPVWDGNEVWVIVAGAGTFAAFPDWYATLFSAYFLPLLLIVIALAARAVAFKYRTRHDTERWRTAWTWAIAVGSALPALLFGVAFAGIFRGIPVDSQMEFTGNFLDLVHPYALLGGVCTLLLCLAQGAAFLSYRTTGEVRARAGRLAFGLDDRHGRRRARLHARDGVGRAARDHPRLDGDRRDRARGGGGRARAPRAGGVDVRRDLGDDRLLLPLLLRPALPRRARLVDPRRLEPDRLQLLVEPLHARRDDGRGADRPAGRALLPVVDVPGVPRPPQPRAVRHPATSRAARRSRGRDATRPRSRARTPRSGGRRRSAAHPRR